MKKLKFILLISFTIIGFISKASAQDSYIVKSHEVIIIGTSNIHEWTAQVVKLSGLAKSTSSAINDVNITVDAKTLKSSKGKIMDSKMQDALKTEKYPTIYYKSLSNTLLSEKNGVMNILTTGNLTISGVTKNIKVITTCRKVQNENFEVLGSFYILMTNFNIEPPTALFGALTTADKINITYKIVFQKLK